MFYKIVISHSICGFKRHVLCKSIEKNGTHEGSKVLKKYWTHEGPSTKKEMSTWRFMNKKMIAMFSE